MALKEQLEYIFSNDYPGTETFLGSVIKRIFGDDISPVNDDLAKRPEYADRARKSGLKHIKYIGDLIDQNDIADKIAIFDVTVENSKNIERTRVNIQTLIRSIVAKHRHILMVFHYENTEGTPWRFSWAYKVHNISDMLSAKRYTYVFGRGYKGRTAAKRFEILSGTQRTNQDFEKAFSVQALSDEFFEEYRKLYANIIEFITGKRVEKIKGKWVEVKKCEPNIEIMQAFKGDEKRVRDYIKKMMGRLTFLYFIQRKGWLNGSQNFMHDLFFKSDKQTNFLDDVLEPLFFGVLNTAENREVIFAENGWDLGLLDQWQNIKYLNGGLFEQTDDDRINCRLPKEYFKDIFEFFEKYNFTIDENDPSDAEVGIDPEMLGRIFESLLEDNKDKGAFYTPKDIVQYMCKASLKQFLQTNVLDAKDLITALVDKHEILSDDLTIITKIEDCLKSVKICDPAIGSGAFPMGLLNEILSCRRAIHTFTHNGDDSLFEALSVKRQIIRNNIFGVDIEQGAVDIARLRFWLSIVVDSDEPQPLPNLDYTIVRGNSLLTMFQGETLKLSSSADKRTKIGKELKKLFELQDKIYDQFGDPELKTAIDIKLKLLDIIELQLGVEQSDAKDIINKTEDSIFDDKKNIRKGNKNLEAKKLLSRKLQAKASIDNLRISLQSTNKSLLKRAQTDIDFFDWSIMFSDIFASGGFDIVIGNPPYGVSIKGDYRADVVSVLDKVPDYEIYYYFMQLGYTLLKDNGIQCYIIPNTYLFNVYAANYRKSILDSWHVLEILDCTKFSIFESAVVRNTINTWQKSNSVCNRIGYRNTTNINSFKELIAQSIDYILKESLLEMNQNWGLAFSLSPEVSKIISRISRLPIIISDKFNVSQGYIPYRKSDLIDLYGKEEGERIVRDRVWHSTMPMDDSYIQEIYGRDINKYTYTSTGEYVKYGKHLACYVDLKFFNQERVVVREITNPYIIACKLDELFVHDPQLIAIINKDNSLSLDVIWAILNSKLATFYHFNHSPKATKGAFPKILVQDIKEFPLPEISKDIQLIMEHKAKTIINHKRMNIQSDTSELEYQIDNIVYHLYELTYDEVLIIDSQTTIMREEYETFNINMYGQS